MSGADEDDLYPCPCCGSKVFSELDCYEICEVRGWQDDPVQSADPDFAGGANKPSLKQAREMWRRVRLRIP